MPYKRAEKGESNAKKGEDDLALRWVATFTLPFLAMLVVVHIGNMMAAGKIHMEWTDPEGGVDLLSLLASSFFGGFVFSAVAEHLAPSRKETVGFLMAVLLSALLIAGAVCMFDAIGRGLGLFRFLLTIVGAFSGLAAVSKK